MKPNNAIEVHNITKKFKVYLDRGNTLKELTLFKSRRKYESREVLKGISFDVKKGEAIGLIGENGCGKSTTLKLLTRIMYPDSGTIEMNGRVSSLIELGAGFHPDMSGRQNIYTNASIFGLGRKEIESRINDIIAFSELQEFIDNPVRTYSSGMYMRLAFAVAINVDADILLIDEILAVGDANFQAKCFSKLREIKEKGTTIVIVSHSLGQIEQICERSLWIRDGQIQLSGNPRDVHMEYLDFMGHKRQIEIQSEQRRQDQKQEEQILKHIPEIPDVASEEVNVVGKEAGISPKTRWGNGLVKIKGIVATNGADEVSTICKTGDGLLFAIQYEMKEKIRDAVFGIGIFRNDGVYCYGTNTRIEGVRSFDIEKSGVFYFGIESLELLPGVYNLDFAIESGDGLPVDYYTKAFRLEVFSDTSDVGICRVKHHWEV